MNKVFLLFRHEFIQAIKKTGYIILTLAIPVLALIIIGVVQLFTTLFEPAVDELTRVARVRGLHGRPRHGRWAIAR